MYHFIVNPNSRTGKGMEIWEEAEALLREENVPYEVFFTEGEGHATRIAADITGDGARHTIAVLGGDGTLNEVANGIAWPERTTLGYVPTGSSNDFARGMRLPTKTAEALHNILHPRRFRYVDLGVVSCGGEERRFCVSAGMGFDAIICHEALSSPLKNALNALHLGQLTYVAIAVKHIIRRHTEPLAVRLDNGKETAFPQVLFAAVMNQPYEGGGFKFCPKAKCNDGVLDVIVVEKISRLEIIPALLAAPFGKHTIFPGIHICTCKEASFASPNKMPVHADGESCGWQRELKFSLAPEKLRIITG